MDSSLLYGIWGLMIHFICSVKRVKTGTTELICWENLCFLQVLFLFLCNRRGWRKACHDLPFQLVGGSLPEKGEMWNSSPSRSERSEMTTPTFLEKCWLYWTKVHLFFALLSLWVCPVQSECVRCGPGTAVPICRFGEESRDFCLY